ncbi:MAG: signal recognition particle receptor subunit alpha [Nitrososphaeria archaeon]
MLDQLREGLRNAIRKLIYSDVIDEKTVKEFLRDIQRTLLQADVNVKIVLDITSKIEKEALKSDIPAGLSKRDYIINLLYNELVKVLGEGEEINFSRNECNTILLVGIQGSGKTTFAAKLGKYFSREGYKVGVICADTFRPGAYEQLKTLCERAKIEFFGKPNETDSIKIALEGKEYFQKRGMNIIIVDTAGRHKEEKELINEMKKISEHLNPKLVLLVIDGTIGQQSYVQAKAFHEATQIGGIVITKLDGAAKGGGAIAAAASTQAKIFFISTGEGLEDIEKFNPQRFVGRLLGLGDVKAILERVRQAEIEADEVKARRIMSGKMTIDDLYDQLLQLKKFGSIRKILELIPGIPEIDTINLDEIEDKIEKWRFIIQSMTKEERRDPEIINSSRIKRIARGAGVEEKEVKEMLKQYNNMKLMMKKTKGRFLRGIIR